MAQPTAQEVHAVDVPLTNISIAYIQNQAHFIAGRVFPIVPVQKQTDRFYTYPKNAWFLDEAVIRADGQESAGSGYGLSTSTYSCNLWAIHKDIGYQARNNADAGINLDRDATEFVTQRLLLRREIQWVADFFKTSVWATDITPTAKWSAYATSDPISDIEAGKAMILATTGYLPNTMVLGYNTFRHLKNHPDIIDRVKYTNNTESVSPGASLMARLFDLANVHVAMGVRATNIEGETPAMAMTHGNHALLCHVAPNPGLLTPSAGYTFSWRGVAGGIAGAEIGMTRFYMEKEKADRIEGEIAFDNRVVGSDLGYFFNLAVS
ncbi:MAG: hypothetical protein DDT21_01849 [Syntrophomonadaceae bacterium]|nr:hypothetical protein [Bacillota bacterium]